MEYGSILNLANPRISSVTSFVMRCHLYNENTNHVLARAPCTSRGVLYIKKGVLFTKRGPPALRPFHSGDHVVQDKLHKFDINFLDFIVISVL